MAKKIREEFFDDVMTNLAETLGLEYHEELGHFHPTADKSNFVIKMLDGVSGAVKELGQGLNKDLQEQNRQLKNQVYRLQSDMQLILNHLGLEIQTSPEKRSVVKSTTNARPSADREAVKERRRARDAAKKAEANATTK